MPCRAYSSAAVNTSSDCPNVCSIGLCEFLNMIASLPTYPGEEGSLVNQDPTPNAPDYGIKAVALGVEDEMTQPALRRPLVMLVPDGDWDESRIADAHD